MMRSILIGILVLMAAGVGLLTFDWYRQRTAANAYGAPFTLVDQKGAPDHRGGVSRPPDARCSSASPIAPKSARPRCSRWTAG